jgi:hypothetical protein
MEPNQVWLGRVEQLSKPVLHQGFAAASPHKDLSDPSPAAGWFPGQSVAPCRHLIAGDLSHIPFTLSEKFEPSAGCPRRSPAF